jgi:hypothetical protein
MKKSFALLVAFFFAGLIGCSCASGFGIRKDVFISYDQLGTDAAYKQFRKANRQNQAEILISLVDHAEKEYKNCESLNDLYDVVEHVELIKNLFNNGDQRFIAITTRIRKLERNLYDTIDEVKGSTTTRIVGGSTGYSGYGQELD